ncbi:FecR family protein [Acinetobacter larvae]|uniref:FecR protein domain-containing protein n=1 Tax=Acinetobacter larvae TaxID=1789224 RepID=A0A1B2LYQ0_9GAMM|nr:FecR domain-containing protein [Acinetobacter larvae]AOA58051.1 hypothetical protein BFG52_06590 [Acinetobacter larvae]
MKKNRQLPPEIALWIIRLECDDPVEQRQAQQEFNHWLDQHPEYQELVQDAVHFNQNIQALPKQHQISGEVLDATLNAVNQNKRQLFKSFTHTTLAIASLALLGSLLYQALPLDYYFSDYRTQSAEGKNIVLEDGTKISLNANSAINVDYSTQQRTIKLVRGDIYVDVAKDPNRPLVVYGSEAQFKALGTRFIVHQYYQRNTLRMLHSKVRVSSASPSSQSQVIHAGQSIDIRPEGLGAVKNTPIDSSLFSWQQQQIIADKLPLPDVLDRLNAYHSGYIIYSRKKLEHIKVTGIINTQQDLTLTLQLLKTQYPELEFDQVAGLFVHAYSTATR